MVVALPLGKLIYLGIKEVSKPISRRIKAGAVRSPLFRKYICMPPAQFLHKLEVFVKLRWMGATGPTHIKPLTDERAAELGAEIIGDAFVYSVAASMIIFEYHRSRKKEQDAEDSQNSQIAKLTNSVRSLEKEMADIKNSLAEMNSKTTSKDNKVENKS